MDKFILKNKEMTVSVLKPGSIYNRSRFDWTGIIDQISLGKVDFLGIESDGSNKGTEGIGLSSEFGIRTPLSYWKTMPGKPFMKIGVGSLTRDSIKPYNFFHDYPVHPFQTEIHSSDNYIQFSQKGCSVGKYCCDYIKRIELADREVSIHYHLINRGEKTIKTEEYCHNFFRPGNCDLTSAVSLETSHPLRSRKTVGGIAIHPRRIEFPEDPDSVFYMYSLLKSRPENFTWKISNEDSGVSIRGIEDFPLSRFALWGMRHVISPETFHSFSLDQGCDLKWKRTYRFEV